MAQIQGLSAEAEEEQGKQGRRSLPGGDQAGTEETWSTLRQAAELLYFLERKSEATRLWTELPTSSTDFLVQAAEIAIRHRDERGALDLAQKAKAANPNDYRASLLLAKMLNANKSQNEAETVLREAIGANPLDSRPVERIDRVPQLDQTVGEGREGGA